VRSIRVFLTGIYNISWNSSIDTYGYIYTGEFHPTLPSINLLKSDDDGNGGQQFRLHVDLLTGTTYTLVVTTFGSLQTGAFSIFASDSILALIPSVN
jgi:hypothetical protein